MHIDTGDKYCHTCAHRINFENKQELIVWLYDLEKMKPLVQLYRRLKSDVELNPLPSDTLEIMKKF